MQPQPQQPQSYGQPGQPVPQPPQAYGQPVAPGGAYASPPAQQGYPGPTAPSPYPPPPPAQYQPPPPAYAPPPAQPQYQPPPPPYPAPGYYPPPPPAPTFHTRGGVKFFHYSLLLEVLITILGFVLALAAIALFYSVVGGNVGGAVGSLIGLAGVGMLIGLLGLLAIIFFIVGLIKFYQGRNEFGPVHAKNFQMAIMFLILGIVVPLVGGAFSPGHSITTTVEDLYASIRVSLILSAVLNLVGAIFMTLSLISFVKAFIMEEASKFRLGQMLIIIAPIIGIIAIAVITMQTPKDINVQELLAMYGALAMAPWAGNVVACLGYFFFYQGYKSILGKMNTGQILPVPPGAPPYGAPAYPQPPAQPAPPAAPAPPPPPYSAPGQPQYPPPAAPPPVQPRQP